jgi:hypothetical protein
MPAGEGEEGVHAVVAEDREGEIAAVPLHDAIIGHRVSSQVASTMRNPTRR